MSKASLGYAVIGHFDQNSPNKYDRLLGFFVTQEEAKDLVASVTKDRDRAYQVLVNFAELEAKKRIKDEINTPRHTLMQNKKQNRLALHELEDKKKVIMKEIVDSFEYNLGIYTMYPHSLTIKECKFTETQDEIHIIDLKLSNDLTK